MVIRFKNKPACEGTDTEMWFPETDWSHNSLLKKICDGCAAKTECLDYALHNDVIGFWAGTTAHAREKQRKLLGIKAQPVIPEWERIRGK
jgi:WhiB family redox-sensing transcriptional regulator